MYDESEYESTIPMVISITMDKKSALSVIFTWPCRIAVILSSNAKVYN